MDSFSAAGNVKCSHPVIIKHLCSHCGEVVEEARSSVALKYIHKVYLLTKSTTNNSDQSNYERPNCFRTSGFDG